MQITLDPATGTAELRKNLWSQRIEIVDLPRQLRFYRMLWSRGSKVKNEPGPYAQFYEQDVAALVAAVREAQNG